MPEDIVSVLISEWMSAIDQKLCEENYPLPNRPHKAAYMFAHLAIKEFRSKDESLNPDKEIIDQFLDSESFRQFFIPIRNWYETKYGSAIKSQEEWSIDGAILIAGVPFKIKVPILQLRWSQKGKSAIMKIPSKLEGEENPLDYIENPPNWKYFAEEEIGKITRKSKETSGHLRKIRSSLMTTDTPDKQSANLRKNVWVHIEAAANLIIGRSSLELSVWESHQAAEKMLKLILRQQSISYKKTHNLSELWEKIPHEAAIIENEILAKFPNSKIVSSLRYGELNNIDLKYSFDQYENALYFLEKCTGLITTKYDIKDQEMVITKPKYLP